MPNFSVNLKYFPRYVDKAFRILLSVILIWPQMVWAMQDDSPTDGYSSREGVQRVVNEEPLQETLLDDNKSEAKPAHVYEDDVSSSPLEAMEESRWRGRIRWANADNLLQRLGYLLVLRQHDVTGESGVCSRPVWLSGGAFPVASESARQRVLFIDGFRQGTEHVLFKALDVFLAVSIYQIIHQYLNQKSPLICQHYTQSINWFDLDNDASIGLFHDILNLPYVPYIFPCLPPLWGLVKGIMNTRSSDISREEGTIQEDQSTSFRHGEVMESQSLLDSSPERKKGLMTLVYEDFRLLASLCCNFSRYLKGELSFEQLDEEINHYGTGNSKLAGFYGNTLRWLGPYHPIDWRLNVMMKNALWNPNVSELDLERLKNRLELLVNTQLGYTPLSALDHVKKIAFGMNARDRKAFGTQHLGDREEAYAGLKRWAFDLLEEKAGNRDKEPAESEVCLLRWQDRGNQAYARYLLWSLGQAGLCETFGFLLLKTVKLGLQVYSASEIYRGLYEALNCPKEPGVSIAGVAPWANDLTQECFSAQVQAFNIIPGQPTDTLVGDLDKFFFSNCTIDLDLSNKGLNGETVANITRALLERNVTIRVLNLAGNSINQPQDFEALFPVLEKIDVLNLSRNLIGRIDQIFGNFKQLTTLDLSNNFIYGDVSFGQSLSNLTGLTYLDLSGNGIGLPGVFENISMIQAIACSLRNLIQLTHLDLSDNDINSHTGEGIIAVIQTLGNLTHLAYLDLSLNHVGAHSEKEIVALGQSLKNLNHLTYLNLSSTKIGDAGDNGSIAIGQFLKNLTKLTYLDISHNYIGYTGGDGVIVLAESLSTLHQLEFFQFLPAEYNVSSLDILTLNRALNQTLAPQLLPYLSSSEDADMYCQNLSNSTENLSLRSRMYNPGVHVIEILMKCLQQLPYLTYLDLSYNNIGKTGDERVIVLGKFLGNITRLTHLDLSNNFMGGNGTIAIGQSLGNLTLLTYLDLSNNLISHRGVIALGKSLGNLTSLAYLNLSNSIDGASEETITFLSQSLEKLTNLSYLSLSNNGIGWTGYNGTLALAQSLENLIQLSHLDLSSNSIGSEVHSESVAIGQSLGKLVSLTHLDFSNNFIGYSVNGIIALGQSLRNLTLLTYLDLSGNSIGLPQDGGILSLARGLEHTKNLRIINLGCSNEQCNGIGSTGPDGPAAIVSALVQLPQLQFNLCNFQGMTNINWTKSASDLQKLHSQAMADECQVSKCYGGDIQSSSGGMQSSEVSTPSTARRLMHAEQVYPSPIMSCSDRICTIDMNGLETCVCPGGNVTSTNQRALMPEADSLTTIGTSVVTGVMFAALPEALGDVLYLSGRVSEQNARRVKWVTNAAFVLASGSWMSAGASWLTSSGLQYVGVSESKARVGGNAAAFLVNAGRNFSPTIAAATAVNYAAGRAGLWAEKKVMQKLVVRAHASSSTPKHIQYH